MGPRRAIRGVLRAVSARLSKKISYPTGYGKIRETDGSNVKKKMFNSDTKVGKDISRR
tara:strand:- start:896 stop:1069 length:174 start_codon:yes stop_codon:yes gene_type:complete